MKTKVCSCCGLEKQLTDFFKRKASKDGLNTRCKTCDSVKCKTYRLENKEKLSKYFTDYQIKNKKKISAKWKIFYKKNKERIDEKAKLYKKENPDKVRLSKQKTYKKHKEKLNTQTKDWILKNREYVKTKKKVYRETHKDIISAKQKIKFKSLSENLDDRYIYQRLRNNGFDQKIIKDNPELVEAKKIILKTLRLCKTSKNSEIV